MSDTREHLVKTATELFLGKGYGSVGTSRICQSAGVNKGTFYHFFPSKSDLLIAAIGEYATSFNDAFEEIVQSDRPASKKLIALFNVPAKANLKWYKMNGFAQGCLIGNMTLELSAVDKDVQQASQAELRKWAKTIEPVIAEFADAERLASLDPAKGAWCVITMIQGGLLMAKANNDPDQINALAPAAEGALRALART